MLLLLSQPFEGGHFRTWSVAMRFLSRAIVRGKRDGIWQRFPSAWHALRE
jgi:hypothetical protein